VATFSKLDRIIGKLCVRKINFYPKEEKLSRSAWWFPLYGHTGNADP
jgi:hypothetical protein